MSSYRGTADRPDKAKAITAVVAVHAALAAIILTGLNGRIVTHAIESLKTFDIREPPPPPPPPPPPSSRPKARLEEGAAGKKAEPTPVVAPQPKLPIPSPIPAAKVAGTGNATTSGAANSGTGTGAGGSGNGRGGGGSDGFTPAQKITKIPDREYRRLVAASGMDRGSVGVAIRVTPEGIASNCRIVRSSGNPTADALMCQLTEQYVRFRPARDPGGQPVAQDLTWYPNWWRP
jgi:protein TonB